MKIIRIALALFTVLAATLLSGCGPVIIGSGRLVTSNPNLQGFNNVDISSAFEFTITRANNFSVTVTADDNIINRVKTTLEGSTLKIDVKPFASLGRATLKAEIFMPVLGTLSVSGACRGNISGFNSTIPFVLDASGASKISGDIASGEATIVLSGASIADITGTATFLSADVSGASKLYLSGFAVNNARVNLSGASTGEVNAAGKLDADLSGASRLTYSGNPAMGNINTSGASTVSRNK